MTACLRSPLRCAFLALVCLGVALLAGCRAESPEATPLTPILAWPFSSDSACRRIARPFSVENPWDHAHEAVDFACAEGSPVLAAAPGEVVRVTEAEIGQAQRWSITLELDGLGLRLEYRNLRGVLVAEGEHVTAGAPLGESALGLHLGAWDESTGAYVDPLVLLPALPAD